MSPATTTIAMTLVGVPPPSPSSRMTVAVARVAMIARKVSQPIETIHETTPGSFCPRTPKAAREMTIVGAEPRLPATATRPQRRKEMTIPTTETSSA